VLDDDDDDDDDGNVRQKQLVYDWIEIVYLSLETS
jgi:hypothetical protein